MAKLAEVMALAHRHGITHCDIKPKNILIDKLGEPRLIDFGMARLRHAWSNRVDTVMGGTVAYMGLSRRTGKSIASALAATSSHSAACSTSS